MTDISQNNKRIAKNTLLLYLRMFFAMLVGLYTSRVILATLGVVDFGLYGVVGGVVAMFGFLNGTMSGATSRFLTYELGVGNKEDLRDTFSTALMLHIAIAIVVAIIAEPIGLWFMEYKMQIPPDRMYAAQVVFHLSIMSMCVGVTQVPYNASIMSHEHMDVFAYVEMVNAVAKLGIVYLLQIGNFDRLILYAVLILTVTVATALFYRIYCMRHFEECHFKFEYKPFIFRRMLSFSGLDLYGSISVTMRTQGINMLLNMFFGPVMNAASAIATQVQGVVSSFVANVITAVRPQIIKRYATGELEAMASLVRNAVKINFLILLFISVPLITELHFILHLWLVDVPDYAVTFCVYTLLFNFFSSLSIVLATGNHATGKIFRQSVVNGSLYLSVVPIAYFVYKFGGDASFSYAYNVVAVLLGMLNNAHTLSIYVKPFPMKQFVVKDFLPCMLLMGSVFAITCSISNSMSEGWLRFIVVGIVSSLIIVVIGYSVILPRSIRQMCVNQIKSKLWRRN